MPGSTAHHTGMSSNFIVPPVRQCSQAIGTDTTGAAVVTINHILTGITESVNRLSELHSHLGNEPQKLSHYNGNGSIENCSQTYGSTVNQSSASLLEDLPMDETKTRKRSRHSRQKQVMAKMNDSKGNVSKRPMKVTAKHIEKKMQLNPVRTGMVEHDSNLTVLYRKKKLKRLSGSSRNILGRKSSLFESATSQQQQPTQQHNLVELFHNKDVKDSDSEENTAEGTKHKKENKTKDRQKAGGDELVPPLQFVRKNVHAKEKDFTSKAIVGSSNMAKQQIFARRESHYSEPAAPRTECTSTISKNYELPTIASKLKEVAKSYLHCFNFRSIPFCAAKSTAPSHNIGINIQQVMSIMKTRQPLNGISPTLAHNIGLAAERLNSKPLTALVSTLSARMGYVYKLVLSIRIEYIRVRYLNTVEYSFKIFPNNIRKRIDEYSCLFYSQTIVMH